MCQKKKMPEIKIVYSLSLRPNVTGAALRSVQDAERAQEDRVENLRRCASRLSRFLNVPAADVDASWAASALSELEAFRLARGACLRSEIADRYRKVSVHDWEEWKCCNCYGFVYSDMAVRYAIGGLLTRLADAGVPMSADGVGTPQYWRDAAARGC